MIRAAILAVLTLWSAAALARPAFRRGASLHNLMNCSNSHFGPEG